MIKPPILTGDVRLGIFPIRADPNYTSPKSCDRNSRTQKSERITKKRLNMAVRTNEYVPSRPLRNVRLVHPVVSISGDMHGSSVGDNLSDLQLGRLSGHRHIFEPQHR